MQEPTSDRMTRVRAACFAWLDQAHRTAVSRGVPVEHRGNTVRHADYVAPIGASEERFARAAGTRGADAQAVAAFPTPAPAPSPLRSVLVSPARFQAWYLPRFIARTVPMPTVASDAAGAARYAGLVDVDRVAHDCYAVTPRDAIPTWEIDLQVKPSPTPRVVSFLGTTEQVLYGRLTPAEYIAGRSAYRPVSMVPAGIYDASCVDGSRYFPAAMALGRDARAFFAEAGEKHPLPDVFDTRRHRWNVRPDRVAHRGTARVRRTAPMRSQRTITETTEIGAEGQLELVTRLSRRYYCSCGPMLNMSTGEHLSVIGGYQAIAERCTCTARGWVGHRRVMFATTDRAKRATTKRIPRATASKRGPNVGPWAMSERSLARATRTLTDQVATVERELRLAGDGATVTYPDGTRVTVHGAAQVFDGRRLRTFPVREWTRRYVLSLTTTTE